LTFRTCQLLAVQVYIELPIHSVDVVDVHVETMIQNSLKLMRLDLSHTCVTTEGLANLSALQHLETLKLAGCEHLANGIGPVIGKTSLTNLDLSSCNVHTKALYYLSHLANLRTLKLSKSGNKLGKDVFSSLQTLVHLTKLDLSHCSFDPDFLTVLKALPLTRLNLQGCKQIYGSDLQGFFAKREKKAVRLVECCRTSPTYPK